ncbi:hypothetical protein BH09GEM1_BH09GEM1_07430 [soil metagenome]
MARIDLGATISAIEFPDEIWAWLDVLGAMIRVTDGEARRQEMVFLADTPYKRVLLGSIHSHLSGLKAVYSLLRMELVSQAAGQARLLCEGVITLHYIAQEPESRSAAFLDYATIEAYEAADALLRWESGSADPEPTAALTQIRAALKTEHDHLRARYQFTDKKGETRRFANWANRSLANMAGTGTSMERLYSLIYRQLSSYVHGSAWSFRHIPAYTPKYYDVNVVLSDIAQVVMGTAAVWQAFADFCDRQLGWSLQEQVDAVATEIHRIAKVAHVSSAPRGT